MYRPLPKALFGTFPSTRPTTPGPLQPCQLRRPYRAAYIDLLTGGAPIRSRRHREDSVTPAQAYARLTQLLAGAWVPRTVRDRQCVWRRYEAWSRTWGVPLDGGTAALFAVAAGQKPKTVYGLAKRLSAMLGHLGAEQGEVRGVVAATRAQGAAIPDAPAGNPVPRHRVLEWVEALIAEGRIGVAAAALLALKTASRWEEVSRVSHVNFPHLDSAEVVVDWHIVPKARRAQPFVPSKWCFVTGPGTALLAALLRHLGRFDRLTPMSAGDVDAEWARRPRLSGWTTRGIKQWAVGHLYARSPPLDKIAISRVLKHANPRDEVPAVTLTYGRGQLKFARSLGTGAVTRCL